MVGVVGWGATVSSRTAGSGPGWALTHLSRATPVFALLAGVGLLATFFVGPRWVGLTVVYIGAVAWWLAAGMRRSLYRVHSAGGFEQISPGFRTGLIGRTRAGLAAGAAAAVIGAATVPSSVVRVALGAVAAVLLANIYGLRRWTSGRADR
jgi:hypothetical protein